MATKKGVEALIDGVRNNDTKIILKAGTFTKISDATQKLLENDKPVSNTNNAQMFTVRSAYSQNRGRNLNHGRENSRGNFHNQRGSHNYSQRNRGSYSHSRGNFHNRGNRSFQQTRGSYFHRGSFPQRGNFNPHHGILLAQNSPQPLNQQQTFPTTTKQFSTTDNASTYTIRSPTTFFRPTTGTIHAINLSATNFVLLNIECADQQCSFIVDCGSDISVLKASKIRTHQPYNPHDFCAISGIGNDIINSMESLITNLQIDGTSLNHKLHIVHDNFAIPTDGILGRDFFTKFCCIDYNTWILTINAEHNNISIPIHDRAHTNTSFLHDVN